MIERPILFNAQMVRALLDGRKTQTRRIWKMPRWAEWDIDGGEERGYIIPTNPKHRGWYSVAEIVSPYGRERDRLWVREAWADLTELHGQHWERLNNETKRYERGVNPFVWYRADGEQPDIGSDAIKPEPWRPSIHMPRWASRILLEVTEVRVERLQEISIQDAMAEGVAETAPRLKDLEPCMEWCYAYEDLWNVINGPGSWDANPWVWVIAFKRVMP